MAVKTKIILVIWCAEAILMFKPLNKVKTPRTICINKIKNKTIVVL